MGPKAPAHGAHCAQLGLPHFYFFAQVEMSTIRDESSVYSYVFHLYIHIYIHSYTERSFLIRRRNVH